MSKFRKKLILQITTNNTNLFSILQEKSRIYTGNPYEPGSLTRLYFVLKIKNYNDWYLSLNVNQDSLVKFGILFRGKKSENIIYQYNIGNYNETFTMVSNDTNCGRTLEDRGWITGGMYRTYNNFTYTADNSTGVIIACTYKNTNTGFPSNSEILNSAILLTKNIEILNHE